MDQLLPVIILLSATIQLLFKGQNLAVFRGEDGKARVVDAYCPHLGAHLGIGSRVLGNCIECPFHGWRFRGEDGACAGIPYSEKVPEFAKIKSWPVREINGFIYIWHHAEGEEPFWDPINVKEITDGRWAYAGRTEHYVKAHIQEVPENGADIAHLPQIHRANLLSGSDLRKSYAPVWDLATHVWEASWQEGKESTPHLATLTVDHTMKLLGKFDLINIRANVTQIGPAIVHMELSTVFGRAILIHNVTPVEPLLQKVIHHFYCEPSIPVLYRKLVMLGEAIMVERDIMIWNSKKFLSQPLLVKEDKFIKKMRRWYSQFYSEHSPRFSFQKDTLDW